ncbi:hypothetical protein TY_21 [Pseudomonas phage vB_PaeM_Ty]|nr:hypothetical protein TY_21 [Pseudomonas phage vB_PaeM_Ty]
MSIDWSKAPEGATHWEPSSWRNIKCWMKKEGASWFWWSEGSGEWVSTCNVSAEREATFEARPQEPWNGKGLPPVGTVCEYRFMLWPEYRRCEIRYISDESLVVYDKGQEQFYRTLDILFRPLRTHEQIAHEGRKKAISEMLSIYNNAGWMVTIKRFCEILYDAGYRKHVE